MKMTAAFFLAVGFSSVTNADEIFARCRMQNPTWYTCSQDADCVVIPNPCGYPLEAAHQKFKLEAAKCNIRAGAALSCATWSEADGGKTEASCMNKQCVAKRMTKK